MNEEYIRQLAKNTFEEQISEEIKKHLDSGIIFKYISDIENELQSYKQKEDKLREYIEELKKEKWQNDRTDYMLGMSYVGIKVLQILNEGSDKNE